MSLLRRYAWAVGVLGGALGLAALVRLALVDGVDPRGGAMALGAAGLLLLYAWLDGDDDVHRVATLGGGALAVVGLAGAVAVALQMAVRAVDTSWDVTAASASTVSPHARAVIDDLATDVEVLGFFRFGTAPARDFQRLAEQLGGPRVRWSLHDPLREPLLAQRYGVTIEAGEIVVRAGERQERLLQRRDEVAVVNAVLRVTSARDHVVCWSADFGEASPDDDDEPSSLRTAVLALEGGDFQVLRTSLLAGPIDPACEVLVMAGPRVPVDNLAARHLGVWLAGGGDALLLLEPGGGEGLGPTMAAMGVGLVDDVAVDPSPKRRLAGVDDPSVMVLPREAWQVHPVAAGVAGAVVMAVARPLHLLDDPPGVGAYGLLYTSPDAWGERDADAAPAPGPTERAGELPVVVASDVRDADALARALDLGEGPWAPGGRLLTIGDVSFATDQLVDLGSNQELFLSAVTWLVGEDERLAARPAPRAGSVEPTQQQLLALLIAALVVAPGVGVVAASRAAWARRRG